MKVLFNIILIALSLIIQPALAWQDYKFTFANNTPFQSVHVSVYQTYCVLPIEGLADVTIPMLLPPSSSYTWAIQDVNSGRCWQGQKGVVWKVSKTITPARTDPNACLVGWNTAWYFAAPPYWGMGILTNCDSLIKQATCNNKNCLNYCPNTDLNCSVKNYIEDFGSNDPVIVSIVF
ncbi:hypothetical protein [Xenorhabdus ishibashii]|uniref:Uncharacterized protein n=1 Tax=Xenorhabdus ishibashii TaxID=1034471 RepID=A0A2D0KK84_9GAMM|nr:hypothetical protein [Xenorhabdus ishibashii]PHM63802.1 hypothetical protein Xish_03076 [Xenorhabdus ishibashii]